MKKGYLAASGVFIGDAVLMFLAWAGVAALIQTTPVLFNIVRYLGAFYLLWLGGKMLWSVIKHKHKAKRAVSSRQKPL
ncbi:Leucine efflux protein [Leclercia adecarboxylata]|uniref:Leucine efflux protein n=1 Tax=Leclercia adecarboxylata TaxID=83655 RepID=A0A4U9HYX8_9ENTR|nr:Leucine efflux protein [Leclercia adecarboxylata]